jgi:hypothetical protein
MKKTIETVILNKYAISSKTFYSKSHTEIH